VHVAEAPRDRELIRECYKASPMKFCENNELTGRTSVLAHMCHLELDKDLDILVRTETSVAHNPTSNFKLAPRSNSTDVGSLEVGKKADFIVVNPGSPGSVPYDAKQVGKGGMHPSTVVVHSCSGRDVEMVVVDGKVVVER
jgi:cytosine/adenosine deaminase-related metal-dependent hydrolase